MNPIGKLKTKYFSLSVETRAAFWFTVCNLLQKGITMITMPIFTRILTTQQYGVFTVYQSWYNLVSIIVTLNLSGSLINNGLMKYESRKDKFISSMQGLSSTVTILFFIIYLVFRDFWNGVFNLSTVFMLAMFIQLLFEPAYLFWAQKQRFEFKYKNLVAVTLAVSVISPLIGIAAVSATEHKAEARVISFAFVQICVGLIFYIIQAKRGKTFFAKDFWSFALKFNLPLIPHYLSQMVLGQSDRIMISRMVGDSEAAIYAVAYNLATVVTLFINAVNSAFVPFIYQNMKAKNYGEIRKKANFLCLFMAAVICVFMLFGPEAIALFAAPEYKAAVYVFPPVAASVFFTFIYTLYINAEFYFEKTSYVMLVSLLGAALNIALNYVFIPIYGYVAAAYTTVFCYALFAAGHYFLHRLILKKQGIKEQVFNSKLILLYSVVVTAFMLICTLLYQNNIIRYIVIGVIAVICLFNIKRLIKVFKTALQK